MRLNEEHIQQIMHAYRAGYDMCREDMGQLSPYLSIRQAYDKCGRKTVERWIREGLIDVIKDGDMNTKCRICRKQLQLRKDENDRMVLLKTYLTKTQAYKIYGQRIVARWISEGLINVIKSKDRKIDNRISREQIKSVAAESNRISFYEHHRTEEA